MNSIRSAHSSRSASSIRDGTDNQEPSEQPASFGLRLEKAPFELEHLHDYQPWGHHPIHLHDTLGEGDRYRVIHKLGNGGYANVWLCRDMQAATTGRYVAVKVLVADVPLDNCGELGSYEMLKDREGIESVKELICLLLDHFQVEGPNGTHICLVYPLLGPEVSLGVLSTSQDPDRILRNICHAVVRAVSFLHNHELCHGDLKPNNILHHVQNLDGLSEEKVIQILGEPVRNPVLKLDLLSHDEPSVPQYLVYPVKWEKVSTKYISPNPCLIDFGESFMESKPPKHLGTPGPYRAPELILENSISRAVEDSSNHMTDDDEYLIAMVEALGILPEPWWSSTWKDRKTFWKDDPDENGRAVSPRQSESIPVEHVRSNVHPAFAHIARSLREKLAPGVWYIDAPRECIHREIPNQEADIFADLLGTLLKFSPQKRVSAASVLEHEWFAL
ncbi:hypothetical protein NW762_006564 [Fusarium torreyae]|uniref:non-specific serine/threonine protein kinase n=1 Tax=Fusarium torreyae TaxID=1237075 RepID=A0A9W8S1N1_9HYPO|nr:hypothetical protein NW762_006564 [Fusarium torreyae]